MPATKSHRPLQIFLIPTRTMETYGQNIDLFKLAGALNKSLKKVHPHAIEFKVIVGNQQSFFDSTLVHPGWIGAAVPVGMSDEAFAELVASAPYAVREMSDEDADA